MSSLSPDDWDYWYEPWRCIQCGRCQAIISITSHCVVCGNQTLGVEQPQPTLLDQSGVRFDAPPAIAYMGADEWTQYALLRLMFDEWQRPVRAEVVVRQRGHMEASPRLLIVLLFWTHVEVLLERLLRRAAANLPDAVQSDLFSRYVTVGSRMDRLARVLLGSPFLTVLAELGHVDVALHLRAVQEARNAFMHGTPSRIDDTLVNATVRMLPAVQLAWIDVYNAAVRADLARTVSR